MLDTLIRWSLENRPAVLAIALLLLVTGGYVAITMPVDVFPDLTAPTVTVLTEAHGMAPAETETLVTFPIEAALNGAQGVRRVRSSTAVGISVVWVEFDWGFDIRTARQIVGEKVALVAGELPPEVEAPVLAPITSIMGEILFLAVTSEKQGPIELRTLADTTIRRRLRAVPGVAQVTPIGGGKKQYQVRLSPAKLHTYGISLSTVAEVLAASNENVSAGFVIEEGSEFLVVGTGRARTLEDIESIVVATVDGVSVRISDIAEVAIGEAVKRGEGSANAKPAIILGIQKQPGANTLELTRKLDSVLDGLLDELPEGVEVDRHIFRQADFIEVAVSNVLEALRDGAILVSVLIFVFLGSLRPTLITLTAIPLSLICSVLVLKAFGSTINTMTLGGMAIAIGALVDDAIIDVENVFRRLRSNAHLPEGRRRPALPVILRASVEIRASIVFATLIIVLVFLPLFFLPGVEGRLLQPLGMAYVVALFASLVVALTLTPVLCSLLLPRTRAVLEGREPALARLLKKGYSRVLSPALKRPWLVLIPSILLLVTATVGFFSLGRSFLPEFNEGALTISAVTLPGTPLRDSDELGRLVERTLLEQPEVLSVARRTGRAELDEHTQGVESAEIDVTFRLGDRTRQEFLAALRRELSIVPGMNITIGQPISHRIDHMLSGTRANVAVKIFGEDLHRMRRFAHSVRESVSEIPGIVDLSVDPQVDVPKLRVRFDRLALGRHGIPVREASRTLEAALRGVAVSRIREGRNSFDLVARIVDEAPWTRQTLGNVPLSAEGGAKVPLEAVAEIARDAGPNFISREDVARKIVVMFNVSGRDVTGVVGDVKSIVEPMVREEPGLRVEYGGQFQAAASAGRTLGYLGLLIVLAIGFLLHTAFGSARDAAIVMVNLPLALIGGVAGVYLSGGVLSVASLIGFITVFGIATRNGIMLVTHIRGLQMEEDVRDFRQAVYRGAMERLTPILMTALATGLAIVPLALSGGKPGNEIQTPMAIVILFGLFSSMLLNMVVVPALYLRFGRPVSDPEGGDS